MRLYTCQACLKGRHKQCERTRNVDGISFGGARCICNCRGRSQKQWLKEDEKFFADQRKKLLMGIALAQKIFRPK